MARTEEKVKAKDSAKASCVRNTPGRHTKPTERARSRRGFTPKHTPETCRLTVCGARCDKRFTERTGSLSTSGALDGCVGKPLGLGANRKQGRTAGEGAPETMRDSPSETGRTQE